VKKSKKAKREAYEQSKDKVLVLEAQIQGMIAGELSEYHCPFCDTVTQIGQMLCCDAAGEVITAIMDHVDFKGAVAFAEEVMDRFSGAAVQPKVTLN